MGRIDAHQEVVGLRARSQFDHDPSAGTGGGDRDRLVDLVERHPVGDQRPQAEPSRRRPAGPARARAAPGSPRRGSCPGWCARTGSRRRRQSPPSRPSPAGRSAQWCRRRAPNETPGRRPPAMPIASKAWSTPPGTIARICSAGSPAPGSTACVGAHRQRHRPLVGAADPRRSPGRRRSARLPGPPRGRRRRSRTPATDSPGRTFARRVTDITPVVTPQPSKACQAGFQTVGHRDRRRWQARPRGRKRRHQRQVMDALVAAVKSGRAVAHRARVHALGCLGAEVGATLEAEAAAAAGRREGEHHVLAHPASVTPSPTASITPAPSWPSTIGVGAGHLPSRKERSLWQMPEASIFTSTSSRSGGSSSRSVTTMGLKACSMTAARMIIATSVGRSTRAPPARVRSRR